ncbi:MAG: serine/threonine protein kinase [Planctomycetes bacterium]|nr:serine/threonine protein kinase [Planctomycetota bacterium]
MQLPRQAATMAAGDVSGQREKEMGGQRIQQLGRYRLMERLGMGGMGTVYKAIDVPLNRVVALKILSTQLATDQKYVERFLREARSAAALNHPNIVGALDVGQEGKFFYFTMEFIDGTTIQQRLKAQGKFSGAEALNIVLQVAQALQHASSKNIIHRDIKPDNIMITSGGEVKLTDLGLAKAVDNQDATITQAGRMLGTPHYASPEQIRGELTIDGRTDIYSLGMTLYHMVVGSPAFDGATAAVITVKHLNEAFPDPKAACPELSDELSHVLRKMTQKVVADRYSSAQELIEDLESVRRGEWPFHAGPPPAHLARKGAISKRRAAPRSQRGRDPMPLIGLAAVFLLVFGFAYYFFVLRENPSEESGSAALPMVDPAQAQAASERLARSFRATEEYAQSNPQDYGEVIDRLEGIQRRGRGTIYEVKARDMMNSWRMQWDAAARAELLKRQQDGEAFLQRGQFADAARLWSEFPEGLLTENVRTAVQQQKSRVRELEAQAATASKPEDDPGSAGSIALKGSKEEPSGQSSGTARILETEDLQALLKAYRGILEALSPLLEQRDFAQAGQMAESLAAQPAHELLRPFLERLRGDLPPLESFIERALSTLGDKVGQEITLSGIPSKLIEVRKDTLLVEYGGQNQEMPTKKFKAQDFIKILGLSESSATPEDALAIGLIYFCDRRYADAGSWFVRVNGSSPTAVYQEMVALSAENEAQQKMGEVRAVHEKKDYKALEKMIKEVASAHGQTRVFKEQEAFLDRCRMEMDEARTQREQEARGLLGDVDQMADNLQSSLEREYQGKKRDVQEAFEKAMTDPFHFRIHVVFDKPAGGGGSSEMAVKRFVVERVNQPMDKKEKLEEVEDLLDNHKGLLMPDSWRTLIDARKQIEKEIPQIQRKYEGIAAKVKKEYEQKQQGLESRKRRLIQRIKEGDSMTADQARAALRGDK